MAKTEPFHPAAEPARSPRGDGAGSAASTLLWSVVVLTVVGNTVASYGGAPTWVQLACGVVTALGAAALVVRGLRGRR